MPPLQDIAHVRHVEIRTPVPAERLEFYVYEPGGNRVELCNAGARLVLAPDRQPIDWTEEERAEGQAWGLKTIASFHTHGTPPVEDPATPGAT